MTTLVGGIDNASSGGGGSSTSFTVNNQTGTSYAFLNADAGTLVTFNNAAQVAVTIAQAGSGGNFASGWFVRFKNLGQGTAVITPSTSTISGAGKVAVPQGASGLLYSDGTNYDLLTISGEAVATGNYGFTSNGIEEQNAGTGAFLTNNNWAVTDGANKLRVFRFKLKQSTVVGHVTIQRGTTVDVGKITVAAIYGLEKTLLFQTSGFDMGTAGVQTLTISPSWLLLNGAYWFAIAPDDSAVFGGLFATAIDGIWLNVTSTQMATCGTVTNAMTAGVMPSTLGTVTQVARSIPAAYFEP